MSGLSYFIGNSFGISYEIKSPPGGMRPDAYGIVTAYGSPHLARKAEQVPQGLRDIGSPKRTCPLCSIKVPDSSHVVCASGHVRFYRRIWRLLFAGYYL